MAGLLDAGALVVDVAVVAEPDAAALPVVVLLGVLLLVLPPWVVDDADDVGWVVGAAELAVEVVVGPGVAGLVTVVTVETTEVTKRSDFWLSVLAEPPPHAVMSREAANAARGALKSKDRPLVKRAVLAQ